MTALTGTICSPVSACREVLLEPLPHHGGGSHAACLGGCLDTPALTIDWV